MIDHEPARTARTNLKTLLTSVFTKPTLKSTLHALVGLTWRVDDDQ